MIDIDLRVHLLTVTTVTTLLGGTDRIHIDLSPQKSPLPRLVLRLMPGAERTYDALQSTGMIFADVELTIQANKYTDCGAIYDALRDALDKQSGEWNGTTIDVARLSPPYSRLNLPQFGDEQGIPSLLATCEVTFRE